MLDSSHVVNRRVFHIEVVFADEHNRQLPDDSKIDRLMKRANVRCTVTEEAHGDLLSAAILSRPRCTVRDRHMRADDRV